MARSCLRDEDAAVGELGLDDVLIEGLGVELVAGPTFDGVREVADDHVELVPALLQLSPGVVDDEAELVAGEGGPVGAQVRPAKVHHLLYAPP